VTGGVASYKSAPSGWYWSTWSKFQKLENFPTTKCKYALCM